MDNELILWDRLEVIKTTINKYGEDNFYISFSGGKDSTVVHNLVDMALPNNKIPRVFNDTGIEHNAIREFVNEIKDDRYVIIHPNKNVRETLEKVGYPFKSKEHSNYVDMWQRGNRSSPSLKRYLTKESFGCPEILKYQFTDECKLKISDMCCNEFKKKPFKKYERESNKHIKITGMMRDEGGQRTRIDCILIKNNKATAFNPLAKVSHEWEKWFIEEYKIKLCELYKEPYNFERTGCKGCPFSLSLSQQLETMEKYLPNERKQCEIIWKPVYDEYRRIGYRLKNNEQTKLF